MHGYEGAMGARHGVGMGRSGSEGGGGEGQLWAWNFFSRR